MPDIASSLRRKVAVEVSGWGYLREVIRYHRPMLMDNRLSALYIEVPWS